jgi:predicted negative regulator of RcsB-dependent stress response
MTFETIFFLVIMGIITLFALFVFGMGIWYKHYNKRFAEKHSDYLKLVDKVIEKGNEAFEWHKFINQKKKTIDEALESLKYATTENRTKIEAQIEIWRNELAEINEEARPHFEEHIFLRDKMNKWHDELVASGELKEY